MMKNPIYGKIKIVPNRQPDEIEAAKMMGNSGSKNGSITNLMVVE